MNIKDNLLRKYQFLTNEYQKFFNYGWSVINQKQIETKRPSRINKINRIKDILFEKPITISVYFFLVVLFNHGGYKGPYNTAEKELLILCFIMVNKSIDNVSFVVRDSTC